MKIWALAAGIDDILEQHGDKILKSKYDDVENIPIDYIDISIDTNHELKVYYKGMELELPDMFWPTISNTDALVL